MNKIGEHFKQYAAIYMILFLVVCIVLILFINPNKKNNEETYDTSMFNTVNTKEAVELFSSNKNQVLFIGRPGCSVCKEFVPYLQVAMAQYHFSVSYLNSDEIDHNSNEYKQLYELLDYELVNDEQF